MKWNDAVAWNRFAQTCGILLLLTACTPSVGPEPVSSVPTMQSGEAPYEIGETVKYEDQTHVAVFEAGHGTATATAYGADAGQDVRAYKVTVENRSDHAMDLSEATLEFYYDNSGSTLRAPIVIDGDHAYFSQATARLPSPLSPDSSSNGSWVFAVPENTSDFSLKLTLNEELPALVFAN